MKVLVINAGSSSLKYQLIDMANNRVLASGSVTRIGLDNAEFVQKVNGVKTKKIVEVPNHDVAIKVVLSALTDPEIGAIKSLDEIDACGHRVLHGGEIFKSSALVTDETMAQIESLIPLGPLHQRPNIAGIRACQKAMPGKPNVAVFDTAFHQTMPAKAYLYPVPYKYYEEYQVRRYGFHGTSHRYIASEAPAMIGKPADQCKLIICHLGNGSSLSAVVNGKVVDTTMGLTPLEGVLMGTRSGDVDPAVLKFVMDKENAKRAEQGERLMDIYDMLNVLNKKSGFEGMTGLSSDMRDVIDAAEGKFELTKRPEDPAEAAALSKRCQDALDVWTYRLQKYIGAYNVAVGGADAIVFTAGIGENECPAIATLIDGLSFMGMKIDPKKNVRGENQVISTDDSTIKIVRLATNEELMIARDTVALCQ